MDGGRIAGLAARVGGRVLGQPEAVWQVCAAIARSRTGMADPRRPSAALLLLGPTGVGKTWLAQVLAEELYGDAEHLIRIDMSEYAEQHASARLVGAPPGYVGYEVGGQLTEKIADRPFSVVLIDEAEKAHASVFDLFLQMFDEGRLTDGQGRTVDFRHTVLLLTSNLGGSTGTTADPTAAAEFFRVELLNRLDGIVTFAPLDQRRLSCIAEGYFADSARRAAAQGVQLRAGEGVIAAPAATDRPDWGARPVRRNVQRHIDDAVAAAILDGYRGTLQAVLRDGTVRLERRQAHRRGCWR